MSRNNINQNTKKNSYMPWTTLFFLFCLIQALFLCNPARGDSREGVPAPGSVLSRNSASQQDSAKHRYCWLPKPADTSIMDYIHAPDGFEREPVGSGSFADWLRQLPIRKEQKKVQLWDGSLKQNQTAQVVIIDIDVGASDLQQCADAVIRLRAEYLFSIGCMKAISFNFTSGDSASWEAWERGVRPSVKGTKVTWSKKAAADPGYKNFRSYLATVFTYAGSMSLSKQLVPVADPTKIQIGDVFIQGGFPGHAVIVVDIVANKEGERLFLIAQSYMPAQDIHILKNPAATDSPWYPVRASGVLATPEWLFTYGDLHRFPDASCTK